MLSKLFRGYGLQRLTITVQKTNKQNDAGEKIIWVDGQGLSCMKSWKKSQNVRWLFMYVLVLHFAYKGFVRSMQRNKNGDKSVQGVAVTECDGIFYC